MFSEFDKKKKIIIERGGNIIIVFINIIRNISKKIINITLKN